MANFGGLQRGNFKDPRIRRNWNKLATWFQNMLDSGDLELSSTGRLKLAGGLGDRYSAYDSSGGLALTGSPQTIPFDVELTNSDGTIFTDLTSGELTVSLSQDKPFTVAATVSIEHTEVTDPDFQCRVWLEQDSGSGFKEVPGSSVLLGSRG
jgi:hypothetical protein